MNILMQNLNELLKKHLEDYNPNIENELIEFIEQISGVYFLYNNEELVYVGVSSNIPYRLAQHRSDKAKHYNIVKYYCTQDYYEAIKLEAFYIKKYKPKFNKSFGQLFSAISNSYMKGYEYDTSRIPPAWQKEKLINDSRKRYENYHVPNKAKRKMEYYNQLNQIK